MGFQVVDTEYANSSMAHGVDWQRTESDSFFFAVCTAGGHCFVHSITNREPVWKRILLGKVTCAQPLRNDDCFAAILLYIFHIYIWPILVYDRNTMYSLAPFQVSSGEKDSVLSRSWNFIPSLRIRTQKISATWMGIRNQKTNIGAQNRPALSLMAMKFIDMNSQIATSVKGEIS